MKSGIMKLVSLFSMFVIFASSQAALASAPIKALYLTNYSSFWHDYEEQIGLLREGLTDTQMLRSPWLVSVSPTRSRPSSVNASLMATM